MRFLLRVVAELFGGGFWRGVIGEVFGDVFGEICWKNCSWDVFGDGGCVGFWG